MVCSQITLSYARTCSHGSSTPHRVCHPAWENVFIVVCPAFCIWPPPASRERKRERERERGQKGEKGGVQGVGVQRGEREGQRIARG